MWCTCQRSHIQLRGAHPLRKIPWTLVAEPYPRGLSKVIAAGLCSSYGWCSERKLNIAGCCRSGSLRVGEAKRPGPVRGSFMCCQLPPELWKLGSSTFSSNGAGSLSLRCRLRSCSTRSQCFHCIRTYGDLMYQQRGALSNLRHLLLACQRWKPMCKRVMSYAWEIVDRWEHQQPVIHRSPIPEALKV